MKSSLITHRRLQLVLTAASLLIAGTIACSASRSASSPANNNANAIISQPQAQPNLPNSQEPTKCTLTLAGAPDINGLRLGMTPDEVLAVFPGSKDDSEVRNFLSRPPSQLGMSELLIRPAKYESKEKFAGINQVTFTLLDGRVSGITAGYNGPEYAHVDQFVAKFLAGKNLPPLEQWEGYAGMDNQLKVLKCSEVEIRVFAGGEGGKLNYVLIKDLLADKKLKERRDKARAAAKATPTP